MAQDVTLAELRARALDLADMTDSEFPNTDRVRDYINVGLSELHNILVNSYEDYYNKRYVISVNSTTGEYDLPDDFLKVNKVWYLAGDRRYRVERFELDDIDGYRTTPVTSGTVELWYAPQLTKLQNDNDVVSINVPVGWEDFVACFAAVRLLVREESDPTFVLAERERLRQSIIESAEPRDSGGVKTVSDHTQRWNTARHYFRYDETYFKYRVMHNKILFVQYAYLGL